MAKASYEISFNGRYVEVISTGRKSIDFARRVFTAIAESCHEHGCYRVLGIATSEEALPISDAFDHADLFQELGIDGRYRIAWVETNDTAKPTLQFVEDVLYNRGLPGRLFGSIEEARSWLVDES